MKDKVFKSLGASNHSEEERAALDYYASDPKAIKELLKLEKFSPTVWENAVGGGIIAQELETAGYKVICSDIVNRGYPNTQIIDFLKYNSAAPLDLDIVTNPPYELAAEFVEKSMDILATGQRLAMLLKIQFLEGQKRRELFKKYPPKKIYVSSSRLLCVKNGNFENSSLRSSAICFAWFIWEKGFTGKPTVDWFN